MDNRRIITSLVGVSLILITIVILLAVGRNFFYFFARVDQDEVGVRMSGGQIKEIVGPGVYSDVGLYVEVRRVASRAVPFSVRDPEIITSDKQRLGLQVDGDIFRPNLLNRDVLLEKWAQYNNLYMDETLLVFRVEALARQAMKVCVGERKFDEAIIGTARDLLRTCIDEELSDLADNFGLEIQNVTVPNVELSPEVQAALDSIVQSRLATEKAAQDKLKADAEAKAEQARQEGQIRVEQSRIQEQTRQQTTLALLEQERLEADRAVIEARKSNELLAAQQDLAINRALAEAAEERARVDLAQQIALAKLYAEFPDYLELQYILANASALKLTDKIIFTMEGMMPNLVLAGPGVIPTIDTIPVPAPAPVIPEP